MDVASKFIQHDKDVFGEGMFSDVAAQIFNLYY